MKKKNLKKIIRCKNVLINLIKRKKDTYINIFKLLKILFYFFSENNISKNFLNEIVAICISVQKYYKNVKDLDNSINKMDNFYNRKLYFKYAFSKLELRNYDKQNLKELLSNFDDYLLNQEIIIPIKWLNL